MLRDEFWLPRYDWRVKIFYGAGQDDASELLMHFHEAGCRGDFLQTAREQLESGNMNTGLTYSNFARRLTNISIGSATTPLQLLNTIQHEQRHLEAHIAKTFRLDPFGEEICYLAGDVAEKTFPVCFDMQCR